MAETTQRHFSVKELQGLAGTEPNKLSPAQRSSLETVSKQVGQRQSNFVHVEDWMYHDLGLKGSDALVFAYAWGLAKGKPGEGIRGGHRSIMNACGISERTSHRVVRRLAEMGYVWLGISQHFVGEKLFYCLSVTPNAANVLLARKLATAERRRAMMEHRQPKVTYRHFVEVTDDVDEAREGKKKAPASSTRGGQNKEGHSIGGESVTPKTPDPTGSDASQYTPEDAVRAMCEQVASQYARAIAESCAEAVNATIRQNMGCLEGPWGPNTRLYTKGHFGTGGQATEADYHICIEQQEQTDTLIAAYARARAREESDIKGLSGESGTDLSTGKNAASEEPSDGQGPEAPSNEQGPEAGRPHMAKLLRRLEREPLNDPSVAFPSLEPKPRKPRPTRGLLPALTDEELEERRRIKEFKKVDGVPEDDEVTPEDKPRRKNPKPFWDHGHSPLVKPKPKAVRERTVPGTPETRQAWALKYASFDKDGNDKVPPKEEEKPQAFEVPTVEAVAAHVADKGLDVDAALFFATMETRVWTDRDGMPIRDWRRYLEQFAAHEAAFAAEREREAAAYRRAAKDGHKKPARRGGKGGKDKGDLEGRAGGAGGYGPGAVGAGGYGAAAGASGVYGSAAAGASGSRGGRGDSLDDVGIYLDPTTMSREELARRFEEGYGRPLEGFGEYLGAEATTGPQTGSQGLVGASGGYVEAGGLGEALYAGEEGARSDAGVGDGRVPGEVGEVGACGAGEDGEEKCGLEGRDFGAGCAGERPDAGAAAGDDAGSRGGSGAVPGGVAGGVTGVCPGIGDVVTNDLASVAPTLTGAEASAGPSTGTGGSRGCIVSYGGRYGAAQSGSREDERPKSTDDLLERLAEFKRRNESKRQQY